MGTLDLLLAAIVGASAAFGLMRGFVGAIASIAAWLLGGWATLRFGGEVARVLTSQAEPSAVDMAAGYGACFIAVAAGVALLAWAMRKLLAGAGLGGVDRGLGLALGVVRGALVASLVVLMLGFTSMPRDPGWRASSLVPIFKPGAQWLAGWLPAWAAARVDLDGVGTLSAAPAA